MENGKRKDRKAEDRKVEGRKTIVCFGDSNTFGYNPDGGRHPWQVRWPGQLQQLLGEGYRVVEEGLNGRTTVWEDPMAPYRSGAQALPYVLQTHKPIDGMLIMLGTNDCKTYFGVSARNIARGLDSLCQQIVSFDYGGYPAPRLFLISPIYMDEAVAEEPLSSFDVSSCAKARELAGYYRVVAETYRAGFLDASAVAVPGSDFIHMDAESHGALARALAPEILCWLEG